MSFSKQYPIPGLSDENLLITWERGYTNVNLYFRGQLLQNIPTAAPIKKGYEFEDEKLGLVHVSFNESPIYIQVRINGILCPLNRNAERKELEGAATIFWIIAILSVIGTFMEGIQLGFGNPIGLITTLINLAITTDYILAAVFSKKGQPWAYYMGFYTFIGTTFLVSLFNLVIGNYFILIQIIIRAGILYALYGFYKNAREISQFNQKENSTANDLLDS